MLYDKGGFLIVIVKIAERVLQDNYSQKIIGPGYHSPWNPTDTWTFIIFVTSFMLGYIYPAHLSFLLTAILGIDIIFYTLQGVRSSGEHMVMNNVASALGFILGIYLRTGTLI